METNTDDDSLMDWHECQQPEKPVVSFTAVFSLGCAVMCLVCALGVLFNFMNPANVEVAQKAHQYSRDRSLRAEPAYTLVRNSAERQALLRAQRASATGARNGRVEFFHSVPVGQRPPSRPKHYQTRSGENSTRENSRFAAAHITAPAAAQQAEDADATYVRGLFDRARTARRPDVRDSKTSMSKARANERAFVSTEQPGSANDESVFQSLIVASSPLNEPRRLNFEADAEIRRLADVAKPAHDVPSPQVVERQHQRDDFERSSGVISAVATEVVEVESSANAFEVPGDRNISPTGIRQVSALQTSPSEALKRLLNDISAEQSSTPPAAPPAPPAPAGDFGPAQPRELQLPVNTPGPEGQIELSSKNDRISLVVRDAPITAVLGLIAQQHQLNIVTAANVTNSISLTLTDVPLEDALDAILRLNGYTLVREKDILLVTNLAGETASSPGVQGRRIRAFALNYLSAIDVDKIVKGLLSPVGQSFIIESSSVDKRRTRDQLIVEDIPEYLKRVEQYILETDQPPRQVLIEAHILQVDLTDDARHGVDIQRLLARVDNARVTFRTAGFANATNSPGFFVGIDGTDLDVLVEALQSTSNVKTLASPKLLALDGQEAHIQIGAQLGYLVTTTTQTSTLQQVDFLDVGVVLRVTPQITDDNQILMSVKPEVSTGQINAITGLPEEETTEVETTVMLADGSAMIIGGLIQENDVENETKIPLLGDLWVVGRLFQRRTTSRQRSEIIIALVPRLVPYRAAYQQIEQDQVLRATSPLLGPQLERLDRRPLEPELPEAIRNPRKLSLGRVARGHMPLLRTYPNPVDYYFPSADERQTWYDAFFHEDASIRQEYDTIWETTSPLPHLPPPPVTEDGMLPYSPEDSEFIPNGSSDTE